MPVALSQKSTIVRSFSFLDAVAGRAPDLVARLAVLAFRWTPARRPTRAAAERAVLARATRGTVAMDGTTLPTWTWGTGPSVLLVHGWGGRGGQLHAFVDPLVAAGFSVTAFDAPGHGLAAGRTSDVGRIASATRAVAGTTGPLAGVVAHSLGAAAAGVAIADGLQADRVALISPVIRPAGFWEGFTRMLGLSPRVRVHADARIRALLGRDLEAISLPETLGTSMSRTLLVHDRGDRMVPAESSRALASEHATLRLRLTDGLGHHRILADPEVVARVTEFVATGARALGCGTPECVREAVSGGAHCLEHQISHELWDPELRRAIHLPGS